MNTQEGYYAHAIHYPGMYIFFILRNILIILLFDVA